MNIVICIKQVPDVKDIKWTSQNTMKRDGVESIINPCDLYAIEQALSIKKAYKDTTITAISMGPKQAENVLKQAIALGADEGYLLCDKKFAGADTLATGITLSTAIKQIAPDLDIILCGQYAIDGDTAQTGVELAKNLNIEQITHTLSIKEISGNYITVQKNTDSNYQTIKTDLPVLLCIEENSEIELSTATITGQMLAQDKEIKTLTFQDLNISEDQVGIKGSPTYVAKVYHPTHLRQQEIIAQDNAISFCQTLIDEVHNAT